MKKIFYTTLGILAIASCAKEVPAGQNEAPAYNGERTIVRADIVAGFEDESKTSLLDVDGSRTINWIAEDVIGIYGGPSTQNTPADVDEGGVGSSHANFVVGGPFDDPQFAYYPQSKDVIYSIGTLYNMVIPAEQSYVSGKVFDGVGCPMVGMWDSSDQSFKFRNACAIFEVQLTGDEQISRVELRSLSKPLCGTGNVNVGSNPQFTFPSTSTDLGYKITINLKNSIQLSSTPTPFYFITAPGTYDDLIVFVKTTDGKVYQKASTAAHTLAERHILPMKAFRMGKPDTFGATNLSAEGYANTYTVAPSATGLFCFDVKKVDGLAFGKGEALAENNISFADVLWESEGNFIGNVYYDALEGKVYFSKIRSGAGSALISVFNSKEKVIWSWTIWCSDVKDQTWGAEGSRYTFQDRFLGATWIPEETMDCTDASKLVASMGFLYQYGRPVPVPGANTIRPSHRYEGEGTTTGYSNRDGKAINKDILITDTWQPVFHKFYAEYSYGWESRDTLWTMEQNLAHPLSLNKIWQTQDNTYGKSYALGVTVTGATALWKVNKTNYDPCPVGYRVPQEKEMQIFYNDGNGDLTYTNGSSMTANTNSGFYGAYTTREDNFIWIPKAGLRTMGSNMSSNSYSFTMGYWGDWVHSKNSHWYDGTANIWCFNPNDTQLDLMNGNGFGDSSSWACASTGDVVQKFFHMGGIDKKGPRVFTTATTGKPVVGCVAESMSIRCVKIQ